MTQPTPSASGLPGAPDPNTGSTEPLAGVGILTGAVAAIIGILAAFGVHLTVAERDSILIGIGPVSAAVVWLWGRRKVFSPATVARLLVAARK